MLVRAIGLATTGAAAGVSPTIFMLKPTGISLVALIAFTANLAASTAPGNGKNSPAPWPYSALAWRST